MKQVEMTDEKRDRLLLKVRMRQETNIDPSTINSKVSAIEQVTKTIEQTTAYLREIGLLEWDYGGPLYTLKSACEKALQEFHDGLTGLLVEHYEGKYLPNMTLNVKEFVAVMEKKAGKGKFDAEAIEDRMCELMKTGGELTIEQLLVKARSLLPFSREEKADSILNGRHLHLRVFLREINLLTNRELCLDEAENVEALDKLSKVVIFGADPVTVQSSILSHVPRGYVQSTHIIRKHFTNSKPITSVRFFANHKFTATYENSEQARRVAEALVTRKVNLTAPSQKTPQQG